MTEDPFVVTMRTLIDLYDRDGIDAENLLDACEQYIRELRRTRNYNAKVSEGR